MTERACGTVRLRTDGREPGGLRRGHEEITLLPGSALRMLPARRAVIIQGRAAPVIVRVEQVRHRADYKRQSRISPAALPAPRPVPAVTPGLPGHPAVGTRSAVPGELPAAATARPEP